MLQFGQRTIDIAARMGWPLDSSSLQLMVLTKRIALRKDHGQAEAAFAGARVNQFKNGWNEPEHATWGEQPEKPLGVDWAATRKTTLERELDAMLAAHFAETVQQKAIARVVAKNEVLRRAAGRRYLRSARRTRRAWKAPAGTMTVGQFCRKYCVPYMNVYGFVRRHEVAHVAIGAAVYFYEEQLRAAYADRKITRPALYKTLIPAHDSSVGQPVRGD